MMPRTRDESHLASGWLQLLAAALAGLALVALFLATGGTLSPLALSPVMPVILLHQARRPLVSPVLLGGAALAVVAAVAVVHAAGLVPPVHPAWVVGPVPTAVAAVALVIAGTAGGRRIRSGLEHARTEAVRAQDEAVIAARLLRTDLVATASALAHELKNPLASIQGLGTLMRSKATPGTPAADDLARLVDEVHALGARVEELLTLSRPLARTPIEQTAARALLEEAVANAAPAARIDAPEGLALVLDARKTRRILEMLARLARESGPGGVAVEARGGEPVTLTVTSVGDEKRRPRGAEASPDLAVARALAEQQGATLEVEQDDRGFRAVLSFSGDDADGRPTPRSAAAQPGPPLAGAFARIPRVQLVIGAVSLSVFIGFGAEPWRIAALAGVHASALALRLAWSRGGRATVPPPRLFALLLLAIIGGCAVSGGLASPSLPALVNAAATAAILLDQAASRRALLAALGAVLGLALLEAALPDAMRPPSFLDRDGHGIGRAVGDAFYFAFTAVGVVQSGRASAGVRLAHDEAHAVAIEARRQREIDLRARSAQLGDLLGDIARELAAPLAAVAARAARLRDAAPPGGRDSARLEVLSGEVARMQKILDEYLGFSRPIATADRRPVALDALLAGVARAQEGLARAREVRVEAAPAPGLRVSGDAAKLAQILGNLLKNAVEASPPGGSVLVSARPVGPAIEVWVDDEGPGVSETVRGRLFEPGTTTKPEGSGLGLVIARGLSEQHDGDLRLDARPGGGCRAVLSLPALGAAEEGDGK